MYNQKRITLKCIRDYRFFVAITLFAIGVTAFVILFFYINASAILLNPSEYTLKTTTLYFTFAMLLLTIAFIFFIRLIVKQFVLSGMDEHIRLKHKFESMNESMGEGVLALSKDGLVTFVNKAALNILGYQKDEVIKQNAHELIHYETRDGIFVPKHECSVLKSLAQNGSCASDDDIYIKKDGTKIDVSFVATPLLINGKNEGSMVVFSDITKKKRNYKKLLLSDTIVKNIREGVLVTDKHQIIVFANAFFESVTGYSPESIIGKKPSILKSGLHDEKFYQDMWIRLDMNGCWEGEIWNRKKDGKLYAGWLNINVVNDNSEAGGKFYVGVFSDITERKLIEDELLKEREQFKKQATHDSLTGLSNRQSFEETLAIELERHMRHGIVFSLIMLDIDNFKNVNDTYGHDIGDITLKSVAKLLKDNVRKIDTVCRWGGEEFIILTPQTHIKGAASLAESLRELITTNIFETTGRISCSFGVVSLDESDSKDSILKRVDNALYISKQEGKNKVTLL